MAHVLIIGSGSIGINVAKLLADSNHEVTVIVRSPQRAKPQPEVLLRDFIELKPQKAERLKPLHKSKYHR